MRMTWRADCFAWRIFRRPHFIEQQKRIDLIELCGWKWTANIETTAFNRVLRLNGSCNFAK
jgi:hypothetical protein